MKRDRRNEVIDKAYGWASRVLTTALIACLVACVSPRNAPYVRIHLDESVPISDRHYIAEGAIVWSTFGFDLTADGEIPKCVELDEVDCARDFWAVMKDGPSPARYQHRDRVLEFDVALTGYELWAYAQHELGHALISLEHHHERGIMASESGIFSSVLSDADVEWASTGLARSDQ